MQLVSPHAPTVPIFWGQGRQDPLVKYELASASADTLSKMLDIPVTSNTNEVGGISFNVYEGIGHTTNQKELDDLRAWITRLLPTK
jgi:predicted esterase